MELLATEKLAIQKHQSDFFDANLNKTYMIGESINTYKNDVINFYTSRSKFSYTSRDFKKIDDDLSKIIGHGGGIFDPRNRNVLNAELSFSFPIKEEWARYNYVINDKKLSGHLELKGTIDLVTKEQDCLLEITDYKTGKRSDMVTGNPKNFNYLMDQDIQTAFYHYAISKLYPEHDVISFVMFFSSDGGPYNVYFEKNKLKKTEAIIRDAFSLVGTMPLPNMNNGWWCDKVCFDRPEYLNYKNSGESCCEFYSRKIHEIGINEVIKQYCDAEMITEYGDHAGTRN